MKRIRLERMTLTNFKGIKEFWLNPKENDVSIFGTNGTGKTSIVDAFTWLLFGKDSNNKSDFSIKTLVKGKATPMLEHEVEAVIMINDDANTLTKIYKEVWKKKRGSATSEFSGHETLHYINTVPVKKSEYTKFIEENITEEEIFRLLTSPNHFNEVLDWKQRRNILLRLAGEVSNMEIFSLNPKLKGLEVVLDGKKIEDFRKVQSARQKKINEELQTIPIRVNEISLSLPEGEENVESMKEEVAELDKQIDELQGQISNIRNGNAVLTKRGEKMTLQHDIEVLKRDSESDSKEEVYKLKAKLQELYSNLQNVNRKKQDKQRDIDYNLQKIERIEVQIQAGRKQYKEVNAREFTATEKCECPTCGQGLPEEHIAATNEKALAQFNAKKSEELGAIKASGKSNVEEQTAIKDKSVIISQEVDGLTLQADKLEKDITETKEALEKAEKDVYDITTSDLYKSYIADLDKLDADIKRLEETAEEAIEGITEEVAELKTKRSGLNSELAVFANVPQLKERINKLKHEEEVLAAEYEGIEKNLFLTDEFIRAKVKVMEERINSHFELATFKLFETQVNGGLQEVCETLYDGVPYSSGLNNAARINVGLDIIKTLSKFHGIESVVFLDNAEAVVDLIQMDAQVISLIVSGQDKTLRVERKEEVTV